MELKYYDEHLRKLLNGKDFCEEVFTVVDGVSAAFIDYQILIGHTNRLKKENPKSLDD